MKLRGFCSITAFVFAVSGCTLYATEAAFIEETYIYNIHLWVYNNIEYRSDEQLYGKAEYYATPEETVNNGAGDCEDMATLIAYVYYRNTGKKVQFSVQRGPDGLHMAAYYEGNYFDPTIGFFVYSAPTYNELYKLDYDFMMSIVGRN
jgi:hypothetical protein